MGILIGFFPWGFCMGKFGRGRVLWAVFQTLCVFIYIHYRHYKCELALLKAQCPSRNRAPHHCPSPLGSFFALFATCWASKLSDRGKSTGGTRVGVIKGDFKWGY